MNLWSYEMGVGLIVVLLLLVLTTWKFLNLLWFEPKRIEKSLRAQGLKGSQYKFLFGDMKEMVQMTRQSKSKPIGLEDDIVLRVSPFVHKTIQAYGKICFTWMGSKPTVHITEPTMVREILTNYCTFQKSRRTNPLLKKLTKGIIDLEAEQWVKHRKIIKPAFHVEKLKNIVPAFYMSCNEMMDKWERMLTEKCSCEVDVWPYLQDMTNDVISRAVFGDSYDKGKKIFELQQEIIELGLKSAQSTYIPGLRFLPTESNKKMKELDQKVIASIKSIIDERLLLMKAGKCDNDDLLGTLLNSNDNEIKQDKNMNFGLKTEEIIEECKLLYLAGQETTLNLLVWTMVLLSQHTDWQTRARDEVLQVFGDKALYYEGLSQLKIVNMIFSEVLRLYPPAIQLGRMVHNKTKLGDITLPVGTLLQINVLHLHHDRDIWGNDVKEFKPERFYEGVAKVTGGQACYFPFSGGPRICVGQNFAMLEAKITIAMILQRFVFELSPLYSHAPHVVLTLQPQLGAYVNMILSEVLRLYPPLPQIGRTVHTETKLGDLTLPAGTFIQINVLHLHHDRDIWGDDVKEFKPERFSEGVAKVTGGQTCYLPFSTGPRVCIGQNFAMLQAKMTIAMILQRFAFELSSSYSHAPHFVFTLQPQLGAYLCLPKL